MRKETILTLRRIKREKKQSGCKQCITSTLITGQSTGNLFFKWLRAVPSHEDGKYLPNSKQSARKVNFSNYIYKISGKIFKSFCFSMYSCFDVNSSQTSVNIFFCNTRLSIILIHCSSRAIICTFSEKIWPIFYLRIMRPGYVSFPKFINIRTTIIQHLRILMSASGWEIPGSKLKVGLL